MKMDKRTNLKHVFDECNSNNILISLNESCCDSSNLDKKLNSTQIGYIYAEAKSPDGILEEIEEEGSATVFWRFDGRSKVQNIELGYLISNIFKKNGYIVEWDENMERKIAAVIEKSDLPPRFMRKWHIKHAIDRTDPDEHEIFKRPVSDTEDEDIVDQNTNKTLEHELSDIEDELTDGEDRVDTDIDVIFEKMDQTNFFSGDEEDNVGNCDPSDEEGDETVCPPNCNCVNCKAEIEDC